MSERSHKLPQPAERPIETVLEEFLQDQRARLKANTIRKCEAVIDLFQASLNHYAYQGLDASEEALFDRFYDASGSAHREFCQIFGPDKISENVGEFLNYFMVRKVICGKDLLRSSGTVMKKLGRWLGEKGYVGGDEAEIVTDHGADAARDLPVAEELCSVLMDYADRRTPQCEETVEDHFTLEAVEPGELHLSGLSAGEGIVIGVSRAITDACRTREGWTIAGAIGKTSKGWCLLEVWNVYP